MESQIRQQRKMMFQLVLGMVKLCLSSVDPQRPDSQVRLTDERKEQDLNVILLTLK